MTLCSLHAKHAKHASALVFMLATLLACADDTERMSKPDAGPSAGSGASDAEPLTACPDMPFDHNDMPCVGDFQCRTPVKCCNGGMLCSEQGHQCMNGVFKYLGFNDTCFGQPP